MSETNTSAVIGIDGIAPIYQPNQRWAMWSLKEIYFGQAGESKYVPNIDDYVVNPDTDERWKVTAINPTSLIPTLSPITAEISAGMSEVDMLLGVGPGTQSDTYRVYIDKSVTPHTLAVDARLHVGGDMVKTAMIFLGSDFDGTSKVISALYDQQGTLLGQAIPLELVAMEGNTNLAIKTVPVCYTLEDLKDGEVVTAIFYSDAGHVVSKRQLLVENTAFIRSTTAATKYIIGIDLESPFMSSSDSRLIQYPMNVPLAGLNLIGVVNYSDGTKIRMPVDGSKFAIYGFEGYLATVVGQKFSLVLKYNLSPGEVVYGSNVVSGDKFITQTYKATTIHPDGQYTVKLFGYPVWIDGTNGYRIEWFMYDLNRTNFYRVTPYVRINPNTRPFNPTQYGINQQLTVSINLHDVNGSFTNYIHSQVINITLMGPGTSRTTNWLVGFAPNQDPMFGGNNYASTTFVNQNYWEVRLQSGYNSQSEWLKNLYKYTLPLMDTEREAVLPQPNFFALVIGNDRIEYPLSYWNKTLVVTDAVPDNSTIFVDFFIRTADNDIHLAMTALPVYQSNAVSNDGGNTVVIQNNTALTVSNYLNDVVGNTLNPGTGYVVGDVITLTGGQFIIPVRIQVMTTGPTGTIDTFRVVDRGEYVSVANNPLMAVGGHGTNAQFNVEWTTMNALPVDAINGNESMSTTLPSGHYYSSIDYGVGLTSASGYQIVMSGLSTNKGYGYEVGDILTAPGGVLYNTGNGIEMPLKVVVNSVGINGEIEGLDYYLDSEGVTHTGMYSGLPEWCSVNGVNQDNMTYYEGTTAVTGGNGTGAVIYFRMADLNQIVSEDSGDTDYIAYSWTLGNGDDGNGHVLSYGGGYSLGDILTVPGGVYDEQTQFRVTSLTSEGMIDGVDVVELAPGGLTGSTTGHYSMIPSQFTEQINEGGLPLHIGVVTPTGGTGTGFKMLIRYVDSSLLR